MTARLDAAFAKTPPALAALESEAGELRQDQIIAVNVSGRGDKDIYTVADALGAEI